jgi:hypothetical protein
MHLTSAWICVESRAAAHINDHNLFYYPYASLTNAQLPLLKVAALYFDKLVILDPVGASWDTIGADHLARDAVRLFNSPRRLG